LDVSNSGLNVSALRP